MTNKQPKKYLRSKKENKEDIILVIIDYLTDYGRNNRVNTQGLFVTSENSTEYKLIPWDRFTIPRLVLIRKDIKPKDSSDSSREENGRISIRTIRIADADSVMRDIFAPSISRFGDYRYFGLDSATGEFFRTLGQGEAIGRPSRVKEK